MEWSSTQLMPLLENETRYKDVYLTGYSRIAQKDAVYQHITYNFEDTVLGTLKKVFAPDEQFNMMGVGVGAGKDEIAFMKSLRPFYQKISCTAVEPNARLLQTFEQNLKSADITPPVDVRCFHTTFRQYFDGRGDEDEKFHLISSINSLYYLGEIKESMNKLLATLKENGILLLMVNSEHSVSAKLRKAIPILDRQDGHIVFTNEDVRREAQVRGCDVTEIPLQLTMNVTELFDATSDFGNKILDFFTMTSYFRQTAPKVLVEKVMEFCIP
ncbi:histamine N-methyltransferase B-like [Diadema antillarum]|uniref:histamine N-methyltransferase B-like n=1 Tax=Diadema antillarum TaxID=105358 RepID=UPI003A86E298